MTTSSCTFSVYLFNKVATLWLSLTLDSCPLSVIYVLLLNDRVKGMKYWIDINTAAVNKRFFTKNNDF